MAFKGSDGFETGETNEGVRGKGTAAGKTPAGRSAGQGSGEGTESTDEALDPGRSDPGKSTPAGKGNGTGRTAASA